MNPIALRLLNQQLVAPQYSEPVEVVSYMGAMQAQEYRMMRWAVEMRKHRPSHKAFKKAFDSGQIIRLHLMRGTWQLLSAEDYWMMIGLCAPKAIAVTKGWMSSNKIAIPDDELYHVRDILAHNNSGIFQPVIAYDGTICGNWSPFKDDCQATFFAGQSGRAERFSDTDAENITEAWQSYINYRKK